MRMSEKGRNNNNSLTSRRTNEGKNEKIKMPLNKCCRVRYEEVPWPIKEFRNVLPSVNVFPSPILPWESPMRMASKPMASKARRPFALNPFILTSGSVLILEWIVLYLFPWLTEDQRLHTGWQCCSSRPADQQGSVYLVEHMPIGWLTNELKAVFETLWKDCWFFFVWCASSSIRLGFFLAINLNLVGWGIKNL